MWKGKRANAQEKTGAMNQALVGMGSGRRGRRSDRQGEGMGSDHVWRQAGALGSPGPDPAGGAGVSSVCLGGSLHAGGPTTRQPRSLLRMGAPTSISVQRKEGELEAVLSARENWVDRGLGGGKSEFGVIIRAKVPVGMGSAIEWELGSSLEMAAGEWG